MSLKKIKGLTLICLILIAVILPAISLMADFGPKRAVAIHIIGVDEPYQFDLLRYYPNDVSGSNPFEEYEYFQDKLDYEYYDDTYPDALIGYQDQDGFASYFLYNGPPAHSRLVEDKEGHQTFMMGYFSPPRTFKIALVFEGDVIITSNVITTKMFYAEVYYDLSGVDFSESQEGVGQITEVIAYGKIIFDFLVRVIITILVEVIILFLFFYRKKESYKLVIGVNAFTQTVLLFSMTLMGLFFSPFFGPIFILLVGEVIVFTLEIVIYRFKLKEFSKNRAVIYALVANTATLLLGFIFALMIY